MDSILSRAGLLTGRYTSPHLQKFNERILCGQDALSDRLIVKAFESVRGKAKDINLTYFEYATLAALLLFAEQGVDIALLEVGLGGRLDAVNAVDCDIAIITSIALDHQAWLGDTLDEIAFEKAGIMRPGKVCVLSNKTMPDTIYAHADSIGARLIIADRDYQFEKSSGKSPNEWSWKDSTISMSLPAPAIQADVQFQNAAAAIAALRYSSVWPLTEETFSKGLRNSKLPGRLQHISAQSRNWLLDVAHNPAAMQVLVSYLENRRTTLNKNSYTVVFSMLADKDIDACINILLPYIDKWIICPLESPRSCQMEILNEQLISNGVLDRNIIKADNVANACEKAVTNSNSGESVLICGSFYTVGDAMNYLTEDHSNIADV